MTHSRIMIFALIAAAALVGNCSQKKKDKGPTTDTSMSGGMGMSGSMSGGMQGDMRAPPVMRPPGKVTSGPTGIAECDTYLDVVCRCTKKSEALKISCKAIKRDAPGWKAKALKNDPAVVADLRKSCVRTLKEVQAAFDCK